MSARHTYDVTVVSPDGTEREGEAWMGLEGKSLWPIHFKRWLGEVNGSPAVVVIDETLHAPADVDPGNPCFQLEEGALIEVHAGPNSRSIRQRLERTGYTVSPV